MHLKAPAPIVRVSRDLSMGMRQPEIAAVWNAN